MLANPNSNLSSVAPAYRPGLSRATQNRPKTNSSNFSCVSVQAGDKYADRSRRPTAALRRLCRQGRHRLPPPARTRGAAAARPLRLAPLRSRTKNSHRRCRCPHRLRHHRGRRGVTASRLAAGRSPGFPEHLPVRMTPYELLFCFPQLAFHIMNEASNAPHFRNVRGRLHIASKSSHEVRSGS
jgi:hypothetical protein